MNRDQYWKNLEIEHVAAWRFCRRLVSSREEADDLYHDAIVRGVEKCNALRDPEAFRPWFYRLIVNLFRNKRRQPWWRHFVPLTTELEERAPSWDPTSASNARRWLERAFSATTPEEQTLVTLFELEGWTIAELAAVYQRPEGTIKARLSRARAKMQKRLAAYLAKKEETLNVNQKIDEATVCIAAKPETD
jgi:RNA polymerase sigma-70 factor (ECF subfamily)